ncbi:MAG: serine hydrolase [bacterium]|nr:serine hydrolase [bacterium]
MLAPTRHEKAAFAVLDDWFAHRTRFGGAPGLQACVRKKGAVVFSRAYGFANLRKQEKYTTVHAGRIASHSKMFTGCLTLQLMEQGALSIYDLASTHLPWLGKHNDKRVRDITLRDLLTHRSGLFRDGLDAAFWELEKPFLSRSQLRDNVLAASLVYDPNTETKYSNIGMSLLGMSLEEATGETYAQLVEKHILPKLKGATLAPDSGLNAKMKYATGHTRSVFDNERKTLRSLPAAAFAPATGFCGTAEATTQFLHTYLETDKLLPLRIRRDVARLNWKVKNLASESYGLGMGFSGAGDDVYIGHSGGYPGFGSQTRLLKGSDYVFSAIANANDFDTFSILRTTADIIRKVETVFADEKKIEISPVLMNKWGGWQYIVGAKTALAIMSDMATPADNTQILERRRDGAYYTEKANGFTNVGEPVTFLRKSGKITAVKSGANTIYTTDEFLRRSKKTFA